MARQIQIRRGTATAHENFTGAVGEITMDTTNNTIRVHDGVTLGGTTLAKQNEILSKANADMDNISDAGIRKILSFGLPNYAATTSITLPAVGQTYTVPYNCEMYLSAIGSDAGYVTIRLNNSTGPVIVNFASDLLSVHVTDRIKLLKGTVLYIESRQNLSDCRITPLYDF